MLDVARQGASVRGQDSVHLQESLVANTAFFQPDDADPGEPRKEVCHVGT